MHTLLSTENHRRITSNDAYTQISSLFPWIRTICCRIFIKIERHHSQINTHLDPSIRCKSLYMRPFGFYMITYICVGPKEKKGSRIRWYIPFLSAQLVDSANGEWYRRSGSIKMQNKQRELREREREREAQLCLNWEVRNGQLSNV